MTKDFRTTLVDQGLASGAIILLNMWCGFPYPDVRVDKLLLLLIEYSHWQVDKTHGGFLARTQLLPSKITL